MGGVLCFTGVLLKGQRGPCGITEKRYCKKKSNIVTKTWAPACSLLQLLWIRGNLVNWQSSMDSQSREEIGDFSLKSQHVHVYLLIRRGPVPHQCHQLPHTHFMWPQDTFTLPELLLPSGHSRPEFGLWFALQAPAMPFDRGLCHCAKLICSLLPLGWEGQATALLSTHPPWAAAFILHLDLLSKETRSCKCILKTPKTCKPCQEWLLSLSDQEEICPFHKCEPSDPSKKKKKKEEKRVRNCNCLELSWSLLCYRELAQWGIVEVTTCWPHSEM